MQVLVTGGTGFIGTALLQSLEADGHRALVLTRQSLADTPSRRYVATLDAIDAAESVDAVVNLAGASLAGHRWSPAYKREIRDSRLQTTAAVVALCKRLDSPPPVALSASAIGYYGHHGDEELDEAGAVVPCFSQQLCADWEAQALAAAGTGARVCLLRLGVVLDRDGGALAEMARSFRFGVQSWMGSGSQWLSWVHREDVVRAVRLLLARDDLAGPFNLTAPVPVTARELARVLARHHRTVVAAGVPGPVARLMLGEMADELLLRGQRVVPRALDAAGFEFRYPDLGAALAAIYGD